MWQSPLLKKIIELAVLEDLAWGDVSSEAALSANPAASGVIVAREELVFCGGPLIELITAEIDPAFRVELKAAEGAQVGVGAQVALLLAPARSLLAAERVVLNFLARLAGIATYTADLVKDAGSLVLLDTRKTTPGWRLLEKYAVRCGGGRNHRFSLGYQVLIKDNHIAANGGSVRATLEKVFGRKPFYQPVEVEVQSLAQLEEVLTFPIDIVMLDNLRGPELREALTLVRSQKPDLKVELSGGIRREDLPELSRLGVKAVSLGALTAKARCKDLALDLTLGEF